MKSFSAEYLDPGSKDNEINQNYKTLNEKTRDMDIIVKKNVKAHFIKCLTPKMKELDDLHNHL